MPCTIWRCVMSALRDVQEIKRAHGIVGRESELERAFAAISSGKHLMIEGPVGVGKTVLALAVARHLGRSVSRVDGDERYTEQKLSGWFDPPVVIEKGYIQEAFIPGPLTEAMRNGGILFINEMNRMPEGVQNILLPAMDEGIIEVPKVGTVRAEKGFVVIATQNPREFVATTALSEALSDRFELLLLEYQPYEEELEILGRQLKDADPEVRARSVWITRRTRDHPNIRRGASIRAAISMTQLATRFKGDPLDVMRKVAHMAIPTRIEMREESKATTAEVIDEIVNECFSMPPPETGMRLVSPSEEKEARERGAERKDAKRMDVSDLVQVLEQSSVDGSIDSEDIGWAIAQNYSHLRAHLVDATMIEMAKRIAIRATIRRVLRLLGPVSVPTRLTRHEFVPGEDAEIDIDSTLERMLETGRLEPGDITVESREPRETAVALMLDASLSMSGDKLAMATAAIAVLAFRLKTVDFLIITFNDRPKVIKRSGQVKNLDELMSELLDSNASGYTDIESALRKGREELSLASTRNQVGVLVTDGNYTVGADPSEAASAYRRLFVVMTESHDCRRDVCHGIAGAGRGRMYEVSSFDEIPQVLYKVLRMVAQGTPSAHR